MDIKQILKQFNELANLNRCGKEVDETFCKDTSLQGKVRTMLNYIDKSEKNQKLIGYKISNIRTFEWVDPYTKKPKTYNLTLSMGNTNNKDIITPSTGFGLYHMKYTSKNKKHKSHWNESKRCLNNINELVEGTIEQYYDENGVAIPSKVQIKTNGNLYIIGLAGYGNPWDDATILITCYFD